MRKADNMILLLFFFFLENVECCDKWSRYHPIFPGRLIKKLRECKS